MTESQRLALIGSIYEAIGEEGALPQVMSSLCAYLGATVAFWYVVRKGATGRAARSPFLFDGVFGASAQTLHEFRDEMWRHDYALRATSLTNRTTETHELISEAELARNDYAHWLRTSAGVERRIGRSADIDAGVVAGWALHMPIGLRRSVEERTEFDLLAPHVANLFRLTSLFGDVTSRRATLEQVIDSYGHAALLLAADGRICWASAASERLLNSKDGMSWSKNRLTFAAQDAKQSFEELLLRAASHDRRASMEVIDRIKVPRPSGRFPYVLELSPAPEQFCSHLHGESAFLLTIQDPDALIDARPERWSEMFGLTRMESRVAMLTMRGLPDATIAEQMDIAVGTVRSHQKELLAKTRTNSKAEVAHLLTRLT